MKPKLNISFSGGRTSAVMTKLLWDGMKDTHDIVITFANTGCEHEATLEFVKQCQDHWQWPVVWLEAVVNPEKGKGIRHKVVTYETAARDGEPFEAFIAKEGIPNAAAPRCNDRLKLLPMKSYLKTLGYTVGANGNSLTCIGIRADEAKKRAASEPSALGIWYPMVDWGMNKRDVALEIQKWPFDLEIPNDAYGNCTWCWKKSKRKHLTLAKECPSVFDFPKRMEAKYGGLYPERVQRDDGKVVFFRKHESAEDILTEVQTRDFEPYVDDPWDHGIERGLFDDELDRGGACSDGCEIGADDVFNMTL